ncbi:MAG: hypothetical protein U0572_17455 [Phycisphaerales bacterium]
MDREFRDALLAVIATLDRLRVPHYVGGSIASSHHGVPRSTIDADVIAALTTDAVHALCAALKDRFYVDEETASDAVRTGRSFNLIHLESAVKVDVFPARTDAFRHSAIGRARRDADGVPIASPEDTILAKLRWFRAGGETSQQQWRDMLGVVRVQAGRLDESYLDRWASALGVEDLLRRLRQEA